MKMTRLIPMLPVRSMPASVEFYRKLGFSVEKRNDDWRWAMLSFGECRLMVDESINVHPQVPRTSVLYLYPDDIKAVPPIVARQRIGRSRVGYFFLRHDRIPLRRSGRKQVVDRAGGRDSR